MLYSWLLFIILLLAETTNKERCNVAKESPFVTNASNQETPLDYTCKWHIVQQNQYQYCTHAWKKHAPCNRNISLWMDGCTIGGIVGMKLLHAHSQVKCWEGRVLGQSDGIGNKMLQWILCLDGQIIAHQTARPLMADELNSPFEAARCKAFFIYWLRGN